MGVIKILSIFLILLSPSRLVAGEIILQSTTSTKNSGFYDYILPFVKKSIDVDVKGVAVGTGQAIENSKDTLKSRPIHFSELSMHRQCTIVRWKF